MKKNVFKKTSRIVALLLVVLVLASALASCAPTVSGTYYSGDKTVTMTYVELAFSGKKVKITNYVAGTKVFETNAEYSLNKDETKITISVPDDAEAAAKAYNGDFAFSKNDDGIKVGIVTYKKG